jgi:hypothetical protein
MPDGLAAGPRWGGDRVASCRCRSSCQRRSPRTVPGGYVGWGVQESNLLPLACRARPGRPAASRDIAETVSDWAKRHPNVQGRPPTSKPVSCRTPCQLPARIASPSTCSDRQVRPGSRRSPPDSRDPTSTFCVSEHGHAPPVYSRSALNRAEVSTGRRLPTTTRGDHPRRSRSSRTADPRGSGWTSATPAARCRTRTGHQRRLRPRRRGRLQATRTSSDRPWTRQRPPVPR